MFHGLISDTHLLLWQDCCTKEYKLSNLEDKKINRHLEIVLYQWDPNMYTIFKMVKYLVIL
jgi:hypothetical protein